MHIRIPLLVLLLAVAAPTDANLFTRSTESFVRIANNAHRHAVKRSSGLAKDLRRAFTGVLVEPVASGNQKVFCVSAPSGGLTASNNTGGGGGSSSPSASSARPSGTARGSASSSGSPPSSTSSGGGSASSSPWKLAQSYVSASPTKDMSGKAHLT